MKSIGQMEPQCQFYVLRKKRLCRMTVRPGRQYCGEHEPRPVTVDGQDDTRIPCPNDPKHTCYASKLQKHLSICNARPQEEPEYIQRNVNVPPAVEVCARRPLSEVAPAEIQKVIDKINLLYDEHVKDNIASIPEQPIHHTVMEEFSTPGRTESSLRHLRQASSILHIVEAEGLVRDGTCYVELGAGKGQLACYAWQAWCGGRGGGVLLVDRAALRHKRDGKLRGRGAARLRADLAHLRLARAPGRPAGAALVGLAKHLCGVATDYALRCVVGDSSCKTVGVVMATCCHHRCQINGYVGELQDLGITGEEFNIMLGIVSWATCGDGRSRERRKNDKQLDAQSEVHDNLSSGSQDQHDRATDNGASAIDNNLKAALSSNTNPVERGDERKLNNRENGENYDKNVCDNNTDGASSRVKLEIRESNEHNSGSKPNSQAKTKECVLKASTCLDIKSRELVGRRAKALIDWGRILFLKQHGFDARLCYYVPQSVSLENVCIVATKLD